MLSDAKGIITEKTEAAKNRFLEESNLARDGLKEDIEAAKRRLVEESMAASDSIREGAKRAKDRAVESAEKRAREMVSGLDKRESEIANHYLDGMKYGMAGSDGSCWSNFVRYTGNHHEACSMCFADERNPYDKKRRFLSFWNKAALAFLLSILSAAFTHPKSFLEEALESAVIACILTPYGLMLDALGRCSFCHRQNVCVGGARCCGSCALGSFFVLSVCNVAGGLVVIFCHGGGTCSVDQAHELGNFLFFFALSLVLEQVIPVVTGSLNWALYSWKGCLCCPVCRCKCPRSLYCALCCLCRDEDDEMGGDLDSQPTEVLCVCPMKYSCLPVLTFFPVRKFLNVYQLAERTYEEDKATFQEKYPGRVAIDSMVRDSSMEVEGSAVSAPGQMSQV